VLEGDITACFDEIDHSALMARLRRRIGDRRVLALVKAFCKAGILDSTSSRTTSITHDREQLQLVAAVDRTRDTA
jgi:RNA-directed DNA polymerase